MTAMMMYAGLAMLFAGIVTCLSMIGGVTKETDGIGRSIHVLNALTEAPDQMKQELELPFADRVMAPFLARIQGLTNRLTPDDGGDRIREKLDMAGNPAGLTVERVNGLKVVGFVGGLIVSLVFTLLLGMGMLLTMLIVVGVSVAGYQAPGLYLHQKAYDRNALMARALPDAIDLLTISVESGLGFDAAVAQVARNTEGPLAEEFARMLQEMQIGRGRSDALRSLADRVTIPEVRQFVGAMVQADAFGIPMGTVLRVQSAEIRTKRRQWAEEAAQKVPVKILVPLIFCILPCLFIAVLGPAGISIFQSFSSNGI